MVTPIYGLVVLFLLLMAGLSLYKVQALRQQLKRSHHQQYEVWDPIDHGVIITNSNGRIEYLNPLAETLTGWSKQSAHNQLLSTVYRLVDESTGDLLHIHTNTTPRLIDEAKTPLRLISKQGTETLVLDSVGAIKNSGDGITGTIVIFHDIGHIRAIAQQLTWQANHDALTGLVNRREFERRLGALLTTATTQDKQHVLLYLDLDHFKSINDLCGMDGGNDLLRQLATVILTRLRGTDTLARFSGDEFGVLLESCPLGQGLRIANGIREAVRDFQFIWEEKKLTVGVSIGLVPLDTDINDAVSALSAVELSCHESKAKGRDRVHVYRPQDREYSSKHVELQLVSQISNAFETDQFRLYRQKIVSAHSAPDSGLDQPNPHYEILIRMLDTQGNLVPPMAFFPIAERYNLLTAIDRWVITHLFEYLGQHLELQQTKGCYTVNLTGASINDSSFAVFLTKLFEQHNLSPHLICFEVTETTAIANLNKAAELMHELKAQGCRFSLDDFGTGMSSFEYLKYLPVDYIKIDGTFVKDIATDQMDYAIVEAINRISHVLGMQTIAEFVEDDATFNKLKLLGVDFVQGYFIAEPEALNTNEPVFTPSIASSTNFANQS